MPVTIDGSNTPTAGGVGYGDGTELAFTSAGTAGQVLLSNGSSAPSFGAVPTVNLATGVTGTLPVGNGGTGATSLTANNVLLGNGTSAVQVVAPGTNGNVLTSNGTTWQSTAPAGGGSWVFLASVTASNSATVVLETGIDSTYDNYAIIFSNVRPASDSVQLRCRLRLDGSYQTSNYTSMSFYVFPTTSSSTNYVTTQIDLIRFGMGNASARTGMGQIFFSMPSSTSIYKGLTFCAAGLGSSSTDVSSNTGTGWHIDSTSALTGLQFYMSAGNMATGTFRLYGIKNS
jgi:hypothetical protein